MRSEILLISIFFMIVLSIGAVSAQDADNALASSDVDTVLADSGTVSGGVDVVTENPGATSGELTYDIPSDAKTIKSADVYINVYSGSAQPTYGANANISVTTNNGKANYTESLWIDTGSTDGTVYTVNDHTTKCYSDYMIHYDIADLLNGLNGSSLKINVDTFKMENKSFDGRIKLIALVLAYDDNDDDAIFYCINDDQLWSKKNATITFDTEALTEVYGASLTNVVLSSGDGVYSINGEFIGDADDHDAGNGFYYQYNKWNNLTDSIKANQKNALVVAYAGTSSYGSIKNVLSVLAVDTLKTDLTIKTEYSNTAYAGTNNTLSVTVNTNKAGKYTVKLLADDVVVDEIEKELNKGSNTIFVTDSTIRPVDENTANGANNTLVNYTVELVLENQTVNSNSIKVPVLYNGNLAKDVAHPAGGFGELTKYVINGDIVIDIALENSYLGGSDMSRVDNFTVNLENDSALVKAFIYVPYNWFNPNLASEDLNMFNATFNGVAVVPDVLYRDQSNLGTYGKYGYGLLVYDVTDLAKAGDNSFNLTKLAKTPAVYPSTFIYMYNTTDSDTIKEIYLIDGADLLAESSSSMFNYANRTINLDSVIDVDTKLISDAELIIFAASAQAGEGNIIFNGETYDDVWSGTSKTTELYTLDNITGKIKDSNSISFVSTGATIVALQQMIVLTKNLDEVSISIKPEYANTAYAGTTNGFEISIEAMKDGEYTFELYADGVKVNSTNLNLTAGLNKCILVDPTVRDVDENTVNGANYTKVNYTVSAISKNNVVSNKSVALPLLYNGNLAKDLAFPAGGFGELVKYVVSGDIVIDIALEGSYLGGSDMSRVDEFTVNLDNDSSLVKAFVYVPYNWFNPNLANEDLDMFNATFNGVAVVPDVMYRDQGNLGTYGKYGYGLLIYDVTDFAKAGDNSFNLTKLAKTPAVYPSTFIYMYNTTDSNVIKEIYMIDGADLLAESSSSMFNYANRTINLDSVIDVDTEKISDAELIIFAASAQAGEGDIIFNGETYDDVWSGTSKTTEIYTLDNITGKIKDSNSISFVSTGSTILSLGQMIITTTEIPAPEPLNGKITVIIDGVEYNATVVNGTAIVNTKRSETQFNDVLVNGSVISAVLVDSEGVLIPNAVISYTVNGVANTTTTDEFGAFTIIAEPTAVIDIAFNGTDSLIGTNITLTIDKIPRIVTAFNVTNGAVFTCYAADYSIGERVAPFVFELADANGKPLANTTVELAFKKLYEFKSTDENGTIAHGISTQIAGEYLYVLLYLGDDKYNATLTAFAINVLKKPITISASAKSYSAKTKTKSYTITLKTQKCSSVDGKVYLKSGKKVTLKVNGKTYTAKTNAKGQATFKITNLNKKGKYTASIKFAGDKTYESASKSIKITIK